MKNNKYLVQREINIRESIFFDKLAKCLLSDDSEGSFDEVVDIIEEKILAHKANKIDKLAFFGANKLLLKYYVEEGNAEKAKNFIELITTKFNQLIELEFIALSKAIEERQDSLEEHPEYRERFKKILIENFEDFVSNKGDKNKVRFEETIKILTTPDSELLNDSGYSEDLLGQDSKLDE